MTRLSLPKPRSADGLAVSAWHAFFDTLTEAVLVLDAEPRVVFANIAALRLMPCDAGTPIGDLAGALGTAAVQALRRACDGSQPAALPAGRLPDGRGVVLTWRRLDATHSALRLQPAAMLEPALPAPAHAMSNGLRDVLRVFWESPFPVLLQDERRAIVDANPAYLAFTGRTRDALIGVDPVELQPASDRQDAAASQRAELAGFDVPGGPDLLEQRLVDADGRERWFRATRRLLRDESGTLFQLSVLQDSTAEHVARARADHSLRELDDWFELSPVGMVLLDASGLLVRTNPAFEALVGTVPVLMSQADPQLQKLLGFEGGQPHAALQPGAAPIEGQGWVGPKDGAKRRLRAVLRCYRSAAGRDRYMAAVEDRSIEEERDLAQMQIGAMMETAGVGLATFQESVGWVRQRQYEGAERAGADAGAASPVALQSIKREIVLPESLPAFERLQTALRRGERAEVRYAIRHPELGQRWLLTRVEPAVLGSGRRTTSVVTLDVTEQHQAQERSEQLLHELGTILESTTAGIAYLRENVLVRCNRQFEAMLGLAAGQVAGASVQELFGAHSTSPRFGDVFVSALALCGIF